MTPGGDWGGAPFPPARRLGFLGPGESKCSAEVTVSRHILMQLRKRVRKPEALQLFPKWKTPRNTAALVCEARLEPKHFR